LSSVTLVRNDNVPNRNFREDLLPLLLYCSLNGSINVTLLLMLFTVFQLNLTSSLNLYRDCGSSPDPV